MIILANLLLGLAQVLGMLLSTVLIIAVIGAFLSWVNPDPSNPIVRFINSVTEPMYRPIRRFIKPIGPRIDISPIILMLFIVFLRYALVATLADYASLLRIHRLIRIWGSCA